MNLISDGFNGTIRGPQVRRPADCKARGFGGEGKIPKLNIRCQLGDFFGSAQGLLEAFASRIVVRSGPVQAREGPLFQDLVRSGRYEDAADQNSQVVDFITRNRDLFQGLISHKRSLSHA